MKGDLALFLKGVAMGAANVVPGVSGGTIALIAGIYQRLIDSLRHFDAEALRLLLAGRAGEAWRHVDGRWLTVLLAGVIASIVTLARLFEYLLTHHERLTMAFFFGLILVSIPYVTARIERWSATTVVCLLAGAVVAIGVALLAPASENANPAYVFLCGVVAICSMILPGLSGSFVLIVMGNYALVIGAIGTLDFGVLVPLALGCAAGLIAFSRVLGWVFERAPDQTLALMSGFVLGSLAVIWPWKEAVTQTVRPEGRDAREVVTGYEWFLPDPGSAATLAALLLVVAGGVTIWLMERVAARA